MLKYYFKECKECPCWKDAGEFYQSCKNRDFYEEILKEYKKCPLIKRKDKII